MLHKFQSLIDVRGIGCRFGLSLLVIADGQAKERERRRLMETVVKLGRFERNEGADSAEDDFTGILI